MDFKFDNLNTYYETYGNPNHKALVLLHGIGADNDMWINQKKIYSRNGYYVIALDLLCHGKSSKMSQISLDDWSNQIERLMDHLEINKATIIGVSMGGVIAQHFSITRTNRVTNLVISDSFAELKTFKEKMLGKSQVLGFKIFKVIGNKLLSKGMASTYKAEYAKNAKSYFEKVSLGADLDQIIISRKAINKADLLSQLAKLDIPCLIMVGRNFGKAFIDINQKIADALTVELIIIEESMDPSNLVNPQIFNYEVLNFLKTNEGI